MLSGRKMRCSPLVTNHIRCYNAPWEYTQSPAFFNTTSLYHLYTTSSPPTQTPRLNPPITIAWVHVTSSHSSLNIRIDLLPDVLVTFATFHELRSPLNLYAPKNTIASEEVRLQSLSSHTRYNPSPSSLIPFTVRLTNKPHNLLIHRTHMLCYIQNLIQLSHATFKNLLPHSIHDLLPRTYSHACLCITSSPPTCTPDWTLDPLEHKFTSRPASRSQKYVSTY